MRLSVATRALQRGDTLRADDIGLIDTTIVWRWSTVSPDTTRAQSGWIARRAIAAGEVLRYPAVGAPPVVSVGARVSAIYQDGPVRIQLTGVATNTAALGAPVSGLPFPDAPFLDYHPGGPAWLSGGSFGPEGGLLASATLVAATAAVIRWSGKEQR